MKIQFCGAARQVTGSCHLLTLDNGYKILLDCGLFQGSYNEDLVANSEFLFDPAEIDCVVLSHAHMDHSGRLPLLVKRGFKGKIHSTHATRSLCAIMLLDGAFIQEKDAEYFNKKHQDKQRKGEVKIQEPLYTTTDVDQTMDLFLGYPYDKWNQICDGVKVMYTDAGHILGSASVALEIEENGKKTIFGFTGDIGRPNRPILRDPHPMPDCDYLILESTYGDRKHESLPNEMERFLGVIRHTCLEKKGKLIIPAFSIGRTQEIVYMLDQASNAHLLPPIKVYVDSPLAVNATTVYGSHPECFDNELSKYILTDDNPFGFNDLIYIRDVEQSKALNTSKEPCIIISASGMMNAGRVKHHLANNISDNKNTILIVGYATPDTPGGILRAGATEIKLYGERKVVRAQIEIMDSFSAHGDRDEMKDFIQNQKAGVKKIFLVHGDLDVQQSWKNFLMQDGFGNIEIPEKGAVVEL
ncbi:MAG TPA: MBL fold metallo-hydrolase [Saprospiraceae bacterium]|nr:MBL fold metallo-hydrolase [Saprospiraceae bacterium]